MTQVARRLGGLVLAALLGLGCNGASAGESWVSVARKTWPLGFEVTGELKASHSDAIGPPQIPGIGQYKIARMVPEGAQVKRGDEVLAFDTSELERQLLERKNERDLSAAEIERRKSDAALRRRDEELAIAEHEGALRKAALKTQQSADLTSSLELETARLDHELAQKRLAHQLARTEAARRLDREDLAALRAKHRTAGERVAEIEGHIARMSVTSPRDATIIYRMNRPGEKKKVGDGVWRGENVLETAATDEMFALGEVAEARVSQLSVGQRVSFRLEAHPDAEYAGSVRSVSDLVAPPTPESPLRVASVEIALDESEPLRMRPGMRLSGTIVTERVEDALLVPLDAVFLRAAGPVAYRRRGAGFESVSLTLGRAQRGQVEVLAGLSEGDRVSTRDLERAPGDGR